MITPEQHAEIRRLYYGEHWKVGTIAAALGVHHDTVRAALADTQAVRRGTCRATALDPYLPFVRDTLAQYPRLRATRLYEMVRPRGYSGSVVQLRRVVRLLRPQATPTVYRRLTTLMGEEAQVDWGAFGTIRIGHGTRPLSGFVMVLSYSRALSALFTLDQTLESFLRGHVDAFQVLGGSARTLVYDNLKSAVLERQGSAIRFHPRLLELAGHYHFAPRPCTPGRGNEKGKVDVTNALLQIPVEAPLEVDDKGRRETRGQRGPLWLPLQHTRQHLRHVVTTEGPLTGQHLEEHRAEGPDVGALVHRLPARLLRRHVGCRAQDHPDAGHHRGRGDGRRLRYAR